MNVRELCHAIGRHIDPAGELLFAREIFTQRLFQPRRHSRPGFSGADHSDAPDPVQIEPLADDHQPAALDAHTLPHQPIGAHRVHAGLPDSQGILSQLFGRARHDWREHE